MKIMKKGAALFLTVVMVFSLSPTVAMAEDRSESDSGTIPYCVYTGSWDVSCEDFIELMNEQLDPQDYDSVGLNVVYEDPDTLTAEQIQEIQNEVDTITSGLNSDYDKTLAIYDWITTNMAYDYCAEDWPECDQNGRIYWAYKHKRGVCGHFALLLNLMLQLAGIPAAHVTGYVEPYDPSCDGHGWNAVYLNGSWQMLDPTWDCSNWYNSPDDNTLNNPGSRYFFCDNEKFATRKCLIVDRITRSAKTYRGPGIFYSGNGVTVYINGKPATEQNCCFGYTGSELKATIELYKGSKKLRYGTDYLIGKMEKIRDHGSYEVAIFGNTDDDLIFLTIKIHKWEKTYTVDKQATYGAKGSKSIHCSQCRARKPGSNVSIPKLTVKATTLYKPTAAKKAFNAKWKKGSSITGYELQYALNSKFTKGKKTVKITKASTTSKKIKKLKAKKKYFVRIRTYKTVNGKKYYSAWSKTKYVKTK